MSQGSIPAPAGEPTIQAKYPGRGEVYPRACGGTSVRRLIKSSVSGLSPRLRGNPTPRMLTTRRKRSIPAPAGEPTAAALPAASARVYPRACGGTAPRRHGPLGASGLSPRLRGNRIDLPICDTVVRSIPAPAGEPPSPRSSRQPNEVYPRACGGTHRLGRLGRRRNGLSPRLRGNPLH